MNKEIIKLFNDCITGGSYSHVYSADDKFYSRLQSLAGLVYSFEKDSDLDTELLELSKYVQLLCTLRELESNIQQLMPRQLDFHRMFETGLDHRHQNLTKVTINFPQTINFPEQNQLVPESIINNVLEQYKNIEMFKFNVPKIISWIKSRIDFNIELENIDIK